MEGKKNKISGLIALLIFPVFIATAQPKDLNDFQCAFSDSYREGNMGPWPGLIAEMEKIESPDLVWQTEILKAIYGLVGYQIGAGQKDLAKAYVKKADVRLEKLLTGYSRNARLHSLAGAFYAYKISLNVYKAPFLGPKSLYHIEKSIELDPSEPMGYIEKGNSLLYRPAAFGGNKHEALVFYRKALKLMETQANRECNWQQMLLRAFILKGLYETNQVAEAKMFTEQIQKDYGSMGWIKQFVGANPMGKN